MREISKLIMIIFLWSTPPALSVLESNPWYLFLYILTILGTVAVFNHYEDIERINKENETDYEDE